MVVVCVRACVRARNRCRWVPLRIRGGKKKKTKDSGGEKGRGQLIFSDNPLDLFQWTNVNSGPLTYCYQHTHTHSHTHPSRAPHTNNATTAQTSATSVITDPQIFASTFCHALPYTHTHTHIEDTINYQGRRVGEVSLEVGEHGCFHTHFSAMTAFLSCGVLSHLTHTWTHTYTYRNTLDNKYIWWSSVQGV